MQKWTLDPTKTDGTGTYCEVKTGPTCVNATDKYSGVSCASDETGACYVAGGDVEDTTGNACAKQEIGCESAVAGVSCTWADGKCSVTAPPAFCWKPDAAGDYVIEDESGKKLNVKVYNSRNPVEIDLQKSYIRPNFILTSPGSDICISSGDGYMHTLSIPPGLGLGASMIVTTLPNCSNFKEGDGVWYLRITDEGIPVETTDSAAIVSETANKTVSVRYSVFEPEIGILRPGSRITFLNKDSFSHTICEGATAGDSLSYVLDGGVVKQKDSRLTASGPQSVPAAICDDYGKSALNVTLKFTLPEHTTSLRIVYSFKDNGYVNINGNAASTRVQNCSERVGNYFTPTSELTIPPNG